MISPPASFQTCWKARCAIRTAPRRAASGNDAAFTSGSSSVTLPVQQLCHIITDTAIAHPDLGQIVQPHRKLPLATHNCPVCFTCGQCSAAFWEFRRGAQKHKRKNNWCEHRVRGLSLPALYPACYFSFYDSNNDHMGGGVCDCSRHLLFIFTAAHAERQEERDRDSSMTNFPFFYGSINLTEGVLRVEWKSF